MKPEALTSLPKIELHSHLDGAMRVQTVIDLADAQGYNQLPSTDANRLAAWFDRGGSGSLVRYLEGFEHTVAVLQTQQAIERAAYEAAVDMHADGVIHGEVRFAPVLNTRGGLQREDVLEAALAGMARASAETGISIGLIVVAMRDRQVSVADAESAVRFASSGVVGFDLAGPEAGYPPDAHADAFRIARAAGLGLTVHAGEANGPESVAAALETCGADRIGHGIRVAEQIDAHTGALGRTASLVRDSAIPLEVCPTSNLQTLGIAASDHPLGRLFRAGFNITLNTDNRLMSSVSLTDEFGFAMDHHGFDVLDLKEVTLNAANAAFVDESLRRDLVSRVEAGYANWLSSQAAT